MADEKLECEMVEKNMKTTLDNISDWVAVGSEIFKSVTKLAGEAYLALKNIEQYLKNFKK